MVDFTNSTDKQPESLSFPWETPPDRGSWQEVADGIIWLRMPLPFSLDHINLYILRHGDGWVIVDTGLGNQETRDVWEKVFEEALEGRPVKAVISTHFHYDHTGALGWLSSRFKCPVYMTQREYQALFVDPSKGGEPGWEFYQFFERSGVSEQRLADFLKVIGGSAFEREIPASYVRLKHQQVLRIGERDWEIVVASGHSPEHACLFCREDRLFISGDQVLPRITSSICVTVTEPDGNPLADWLDSIKFLKSLPDDVLVLPAHERPFYGLHARLGGLASHHSKKLQSLLSSLDQERTVDELTDLLFPHAKSPFDLMLANGETRAHLNFLFADEQITRRLESGRYLYRRVAVNDMTTTEVVHI